MSLVPGAPRAWLLRARPRALRTLVSRAPIAPGLLAVLSGGCREAEDPAGRRRVQEATITAEVRSRILAVSELEPLPLQVETHGHTVSVAGSVHDSAQAEAIRSIAAQVRGVERIELDLRIVPPPDTAPPPPHRKPRREPAPPAPQESLPSLEEAG